MNSMFCGCLNLRYINFQKANLNSNTDTSNMFNLDLSSVLENLIVFSESDSWKKLFKKNRTIICNYNTILNESKKYYLFMNNLKILNESTKICKFCGNNFNIFIIILIQIFIVMIFKENII